MKLHMIGGPYAGCLYELDNDSVIPSNLTLPSPLERTTVSGAWPPDYPNMVASVTWSRYRLECFRALGSPDVFVYLHESATPHSSYLDLLATHREVSLAKGPAASLKGRLPKGIS